MADRVTMRDVADAAGISIQTVSRVINDKPDVADATRRRVRKVISDLGYRPSAVARSLVRQRTYTLGVVTAGLKYIGPSRTLNGIASQAEAMGYSLVLNALPGFEADEVDALIDWLMSMRVDGVVWAVPQVGSNREWLERDKPALPVPAVFLSMEERPGLCIASVDNHLGGRLATQHLLDQGFEHIGHVTGPLQWWEARERRAGWEAALREAGKEDDVCRCVEGDWTPTSGTRAVRELLDAYPDTDGVFIANDRMALGALNLAWRSGVDVPGDIAVVGFDDIPEAAYLCPALTTVRQDQEAFGRGAVRELSRLIEAEHDSDAVPMPRTIWKEPELIVRASSTRTGCLL